MSRAMSPAVRRRIPPVVKAVVQVIGLSTALMAIIVGGVWLRCGSWELVLPYLRGERFIVLDREIDLGEQPPGAIVERSIRIVNLSSRDVRILGAQRSCNCVALDGFPLCVGAGAQHTLRVRTGVPWQREPFSHTIRFFTDVPDSPWFAVTIRGSARVTPDGELKPTPDLGLTAARTTRSR